MARTQIQLVGNDIITFNIHIIKSKQAKKIDLKFISNLFYLKILSLFLLLILNYLINKNIMLFSRKAESAQQWTSSVNWTLTCVRAQVERIK